MQFIQPDINIDFIGKRFTGFVISTTLILISLLSLLLHGGPKYGIDFAGGTVIQVKFNVHTTVKTIKETLEPIGILGASIQQYGDVTNNEYLIRADIAYKKLEGLSDQVQQALIQAISPEAASESSEIQPQSVATSEASDQTATTQTTSQEVPDDQKTQSLPAEVRRIEMVGPKVGKDLREKALLAMFFALLFITIYISGRFEFKWVVSAFMAAGMMGGVYFFKILNVSMPFLIVFALILAMILFWFLRLKYAMGAITALVHDVMITVGIFSIFDKEFTLPIVAALLTIIGYSLNDTIIVFDRIRENSRKLHRNSFDQVINKSINETLSRTILTSLTTLIVVIALFLFGGGIIHDFAFAMIIGVLIGTYSSIFVASPILLLWK
ncbi:MAG: preprotein translocase subunit SecF [Candidatus Magnetoglobus multicellularis str. Araruama]|uniref:Protein-export membrane protein SecF n=1 Tax=Candidatus Magnetoglobus multicellularis str. Araruama TaxID=890399 RepID=A0A1V1P9Q8_9BACT|nr:MAG: preprotein translocase subunit SecF [Candidatus Magnetoglobus multicellularis str. Araruama]